MTHEGHGGRGTGVGAWLAGGLLALILGPLAVVFGAALLLAVLVMVAAWIVNAAGKDIGGGSDLP